MYNILQDKIKTNGRLVVFLNVQILLDLEFGYAMKCLIKNENG